MYDMIPLICGLCILVCGLIMVIMPEKAMKEKADQPIDDIKKVRVSGLIACLCGFGLMGIYFS